MPARRPTDRETEIKLRVADLAALIRKLRRLRARCHGRVLERNTLYDTPDSDLRRRGRLLRLRLETPAPSTPHSGRTSAGGDHLEKPGPGFRPIALQGKARKGTGRAISRGAGRPNFRSLGFRPGFLYEKFRTTFRLPGLHLDLDETPVGVFLEIEGRPEAIDRVARAIGFSPRDYIRATYWDLYAAECRRRGRIPRNMLFSREKSANHALFA